MRERHPEGSVVSRYPLPATALPASRVRPICLLWDQDTCVLRRFAFALGAIAALLTVGRASAAQRPRDVTTRRSDQKSGRSQLSGVRSVNRDELLQSIATSASRCKSILLQAFCPITHSDRLWDKEYLDRTELRRDVLRIRVFYWKRGYREAQVDTVVAPRGNRTGRGHVQHHRGADRR